MYLHNTFGDEWDSYEDFEKCVKGKIEGFCSTVNKKWKESNRCMSTFLIKNEKWLQLEFNIPFIAKNEIGCQPSTSRGRPSKSFFDLSERSKRRKTEYLRKTTTSEVLICAAKNTLHSEGKRAAAQILSQITEYSPRRAIKIKNIYKNSSKTVMPYTEDEALAFIVDTRMTKDAYQITRLGAKQRGANIYPAYHRIRLAKERCYPEGIEIHEEKSSVPLQHLLDHTLTRLFETFKFDSNMNLDKVYKNLNFVCKWGCDGSSGHSEYHQTFNDQNITDSSVFLFSLVPLRLTGISKISKNNTILWKNPTPSSTRYCRPIKFMFNKETVETTKNEVQKLEKEIAELKPLKLSINNNVVSISYTMVMTMIDGKVINTLTGSSSQVCFICKCNPTNMNNLDQMHKFQINEDNLKYGLSTLHAWIKFLECTLHIAYKLESAPTTKRTTVEQKILISEKKKEIQSRLWEELGLKVDRVVQGMGTSNTGNVARRFFKNPKKVSEITGVDVRLIHRFSIILAVISSGHEINYERFDEYSKETAKLYVHLYNWYRTPTSVHKILIHGSLAIKHALVPIGQLSEEAQESRNKDYIRFREHHSRKSSRINTNTDLFNFLLITSDPIITGLRSQIKVSSTKLPPDAIYLLNIESTEDYESNEEEAESNSN